MVAAMTGLLHSAGVSDDDIKTEEFGDYKQYQSPRQMSRAAMRCSSRNQGGNSQ
jgi:hypothetical protein